MESAGMDDVSCPAQSNHIHSIAEPTADSAMHNGSEDSVSQDETSLAQKRRRSADFHTEISDNPTNPCREETAPPNNRLQAAQNPISVSPAQELEDKQFIELLTKSFQSSAEFSNWNEAKDRLTLSFRKRDSHIRELLHLLQNGNMVDFNPLTETMTNMVKEYNQNFPPIEQPLPADVYVDPIILCRNVISNCKASLAAQAALRQSSDLGIENSDIDMSKRRRLSDSFSTKKSPGIGGTPRLHIKIIPPSAGSIPKPALAALQGDRTMTPEEMARKAAHDAEVVRRVETLKQQKLWSASRIPRIPDPERKQTHWDYVLREMTWMSNDFREERRWKIGMAKKVAKQAARHQQKLNAVELKKQKEEELRIRRECAKIAKMVKQFWSTAEKVLRFKHLVKVEERKIHLREKQLDFIVEQTERYTSLVAKDLRASVASDGAVSQVSQRDSTAEQAKEEEVPEEDKKPGEKDKGSEMTDDQRNQIIAQAAEAASKAQPRGNTLAQAQIRIKQPFLVKNQLREYQLIGLDWLVTMYESNLNGILADEMGLGKTIQTISLLAHLACEKGIWGPHLIVVPTSVMLNWEMEFKRWCPAFKIITYFGTTKERQLKRQGWSKPNSFHVCITSYNLVVQDANTFRRKKWHYMILDEAQNIKNFKSQRWQTLLNYRTYRRLLLTGTPLQNSLMELWSLMHFLMPHIFQSHAEFKEWFANPLTGMVEGTTTMNEQIINRLHTVLRPFILRRLKADVEQQLPQKVEHIVPCSLSKRQRYLYEEFMSRAQTQSTLSSGSVIGMMNVLMQLRKVCNHPDLFEERPIVSPFDQVPLSFSVPGLVLEPAKKDLPTCLETTLLMRELQGATQIGKLAEAEIFCNRARIQSEFLSQKSAITAAVDTILESPQSLLIYKRRQEEREHNFALDCMENIVRLSEKRSFAPLVYGFDCRNVATLTLPARDAHKLHDCNWDFSDVLSNTIKTAAERMEEEMESIVRFKCVIPAARSASRKILCTGSGAQDDAALLDPHTGNQIGEIASLLRPAVVREQLFFPDKRLLQYDCGKLQTLALLLRQLKSGGHRVLIFTQMSRMLDVLEKFLCLHGHTYFRLDGATRPERRQIMMERFNQDPRIFCFILSTRSGGFGVNLTGADTVVFYDSDWNPAMDAQAQDRCHRIGQTREVHIYRLISEHTVEENILKKANQKRMLDRLAIEGGQFTTEFFTQTSLSEIVDARNQESTDRDLLSSAISRDTATLTQAELEKAMAELEDEEDVSAIKAARNELVADAEEFQDELTVPPQLANTAGAAPKASAAVKELISLAATDEDGIVNKLTKLQRYAYKFLETVDRIVDTTAISAMQQEVEEKHKAWESSTLKRIRENENNLTKLEEEEEEEKQQERFNGLTYETEGSSRQYFRELLMEEDVRLYEPFPEEDGITQFYLHPFDDVSMIDWSKRYFNHEQGASARRSTIKGEDKMVPGMQKLEASQRVLSRAFSGESLDSSDQKRSGTAKRDAKKRKHASLEQTVKKKKTSEKISPAAESENISPAIPSKKKKKKKKKDSDYRKKRSKKKVQVSDIKLEEPKSKLQMINTVAPWTLEEDECLKKKVAFYGQSWYLISTILNSSPYPKNRARTPIQCRERYTTHIVTAVSNPESNTTPDTKDASADRKSGLEAEPEPVVDQPTLDTEFISNVGPTSFPIVSLSTEKENRLRSAKPSASSLLAVSVPLPSNLGVEEFLMPQYDIKALYTPQDMKPHDTHEKLIAHFRTTLGHYPATPQIVIASIQAANATKPGTSTVPYSEAKILGKSLSSTNLNVPIPTIGTNSSMPLQLSATASLNGRKQLGTSASSTPVNSPAVRVMTRQVSAPIQRTVMPAQTRHPTVQQNNFSAAVYPYNMPVSNTKAGDSTAPSEQLLVTDMQFQPQNPVVSSMENKHPLAGGYKSPQDNISRSSENTTNASTMLPKTGEQQIYPQSYYPMVQYPPGYRPNPQAVPAGQTTYPMPQNSFPIYQISATQRTVQQMYMQQQQQQQAQQNQQQTQQPQLQHQQTRQMQMQMQMQMQQKRQQQTRGVTGSTAASAAAAAAAAAAYTSQPIAFYTHQPTMVNGIIGFAGRGTPVIGQPTNLSTASMFPQRDTG